MEEIADGFTQASDSLRNAITVKIEQRMQRAFPGQKKKDMESRRRKGRKAGMREDGLCLWLWIS